MIEAGLGGRYDATNVIPSSVQVLTSVGLEHTRWLGPTIADIAGEKLDVVQPGATLVLGPRSAPGRGRGRRARSPPSASARIVRAGADPGVAVGRAGRLPAAQLRARARRGRRPTSASSTPRRWRAAAADGPRPGPPAADRRASR